MKGKIKNHIKTKGKGKEIYKKGKQKETSAVAIPWPTLDRTNSRAVAAPRLRGPLNPTQQKRWTSGRQVSLAPGRQPLPAFIQAPVAHALEDVKLE
jgi:hypothetical protein